MANKHGWKQQSTKSILLKLLALGVQIVNAEQQMLTADAIEKEVGGKVHLVIPHDALGIKMWGAVDALGHRGIPYQFVAAEPVAYKTISGAQVAREWAAAKKLEAREVVYGQGA